MDWQLFTSTLVVIFLAELPDKTAIAILLVSSRYNPKAVWLGVCLAFAIQSVIAVTFGSVFGLLPAKIVHVAAALLFFVFAFVMWRKKEEPEDENLDTSSQKSSSGFFKGFATAFTTIFVAEWGDLTQMATATLQAQYKKPVVLFAAATLALWASSTIFVLVGYHAKKLLNPQILQKVGASAFVLVGLWMLLFQK